MRSIVGYFFLLFSAIIILGSCRRSIPYNPCADAVPFKAGLQISEIHGDSLIETDTILINTSVSFKATSPLRNSAIFEFQVGVMDTMMNKNELRLYFDDRNVSPGDLIKVRLIAKGVPNSQCFPNDKNIDTIEKSFRVIHWKDAPIIGKYAGYFGSDKDKKDKQVVEVRYLKPDALYTYGRFEVFNIDKGCNSTVSNPSLLPDPYNIFSSLTGARFIVVVGGGETGGTFANSCHAPGGILQLKGHDTLSADFTYSKSVNEIIPRIKESFIGVRIK